MKRFSQKILVGWQTFRQLLIKNEKKTIAITGILILSLVLFLGALIVAQPKIRRSQLESLVGKTVTSDHMTVLDYAHEDQKVKNTKAISVMFSQPHGQTFNQVGNLLAKKEDELNRTFYYYPIVYDRQSIAKKYHIDPTKVTFIFFQNGREKNRFVVEELKDLDKTFIPELNRLPMWRLHQRANQTDKK